MKINRKSFLKASTVSALGYSGMAMSGLAFNPKEAWSRPSNIRITDIRGCVLATNYDNPIIKIYTNQDIVGLGEVRDNGWIASALLAKPYLVGKDPLDIEAILRSIRHLSGHRRYGGGYSAIDIALMDIAGKVMGWPCWKLLSSDLGTAQKYRDEVPVYADCGALVDNPRFEHFMQQRIDKGYRHFKMNVVRRDLATIDGALAGGGPTRKGLEVWGEEVYKFREIIGYDVQLGADHFGNLTVDSAIELGEFMSNSRYSLSELEDLFQHDRFNSVNLHRQATDRSPTPTLFGENIFGLDGFMPFLEANAVDMIHPDMLTSGGIIETKKIADYADRFGIKTLIHAAASPVGHIAMVHCAATIREFGTLEFNHKGLEQPWRDDLVSGIAKPIIQQGGVIPVPDGPGLGIEFNDGVAKEYLREGKYLPYDPGFFKPTPEFDKPISLEEARAKGLIDYGRVDGPWPWWHLDENLDYGNTARGPWPR